MSSRPNSMNSAAFMAAYRSGWTVIIICTCAPTSFSDSSCGPEPSCDGISRSSRVRKASSTGFTVTQSHLDVTAKVPGADRNKVLEIANGAKAGCPISRLLNAKVTMDANVEK